MVKLWYLECLFKDNVTWRSLGSNLPWPGFDGKLHLSLFWPQIIVVFMCYICNMSNVNLCCKNLWFSVIAVFTMSYHVICAFEINKWFYYYFHFQNVLTYQIPSREGCQKPDWESDSSHCNEDVVDVVLDDVEGVLEHFLPRRIGKPTLGNVA